MLYEDISLKGAIKKALGKKPSAGGKYGTPKQSNSSGSGNGDLYSAYDRQIRARANRPGGPSAHDSFAWEIVPGATGGGPFESGRCLRFSASQIADPFGGASRNPFSFLFGRLPSAGRASFIAAATGLNGGGSRRHEVAFRSPVGSSQSKVLDLGPNERGRDRFRVLLMLGGANFMTADHPRNYNLNVYRERDYVRIGIARYVERVNFPLPAR